MKELVNLSLSFALSCSLYVYEIICEQYMKRSLFIQIKTKACQHTLTLICTHTVATVPTWEMTAYFLRYIIVGILVH